jgi:hypothetical protein
MQATYCHYQEYFPNRTGEPLMKLLIAPATSLLAGFVCAAAMAGGHTQAPPKPVASDQALTAEIDAQTHQHGCTSQRNIPQEIRGLATDHLGRIAHVADTLRADALRNENAARLP